MIIDCFPFFNELDLLELRLNELKNVVDVFVLSEATLTFTGKPKILYFNENKDRFKDFNIEHVIISDYSGIKMSDPWLMDYGQKQIGLDTALKKFKPGKNDIVLLSDADEIHRAESVFEESKKPWSIQTAEMILHYHCLNCRSERPWRHPTWFRPNGMDTNHRRLRGGRNLDKKKIVKNAGWHFSYLGNAEDALYKLQSFAHQEKNIHPYNTLQHIENRKKKGADLYDRRRIKFEFVDDLSYLPQYVLNNMDKYSKYIKRGE
jgi:beta-1,4-mannosyl-glycoprotein beta-1,4-N-acetylglucosaminyltransferase